MKMKIKMKNRSHRYEISKRSSRHGDKYSKYKKVLQYDDCDDAYMYKAKPTKHLKLNS